MAAASGNYQRLNRIHSRRSGNQVFVEGLLEFDPALPVGEMIERSERIKNEIEGSISGSEVWVVPVEKGNPRRAFPIS